MTPPPARRAADEAPVRVLFFGSGGFAVPILDALAADPDVSIVGVVSTPDRPAGRGRSMRATPVAARTVELGLPLLRPPKIRDASVAAWITDRRPDVGVLADFGRIVPAAILALPPAGILNVHPSLLPRHRGASPIAGAILAGDRENGVSIMQMDAGLDTGPIVAVERWALDADATADGEEAHAAEIGARLVGGVLRPWVAGRLEAHAQDDQAATMTRPLRREDGRLDPMVSAQLLERRVRAFQPWPGTYVEVEAVRIAVRRAHVEPSATADVPGTIVPDDGGIALATVEDRLVFDVVQPAGARAMTGAELRRGRPSLLGRRVGGTQAEAPATVPASVAGRGG